MKYIKEVVSATLMYEGWTYDDTAAVNNFKWKIQRTITQGSIISVDVANAGNYKNRWTDRNSLFPEVLFMNTHSVQFDGVNDRIDVSHNSAVTFSRTSPFTISLWVKSPNTGSKTYIEKMASNVGYRFYDSGGNKIQMEFRGTGGTSDRIRVETSSVTDVNNGNWHHLAVTYDGSGSASGMKLYMDGQQLATSSLSDGLVTDPTNTATLSIGSRSGGGNNFVGNMDEVSIWDSALSAIEIDEIYNEGFAGNLEDHSNGSIVAWYKFDDINYPTVPDSISSLDGSMINMTPGDVETEVPHG